MRQGQTLLNLTKLNFVGQTYDFTSKYLSIWVIWDIFGWKLPPTEQIFSLEIAKKITSTSSWLDSTVLTKHSDIGNRTAIENKFV